MKISLILYKSKVLANGSHPLMVRVSHLRDRKYASTGLLFPAKWWDFQKDEPRRNHPERKLLETILAQKRASYHTKLLALESEKKMLSIQQLFQTIEVPKQEIEGVFPFLECVIKSS
jgi:hypothetical protein